MRKKSAVVWSLPLILSILCLNLAAQVAITGKISGVVADSTRAVVPGATVTVEGPAIMAARTVTTGTAGAFLVGELPPGVYDVSASAQGFKKYVTKGVTITAGFTATLNITLELGGLAETVEVTGAAPVVDVKSVSSGTTFDQSLLQNLPSGRDPWSTLQQAPGITTDQFDVGGSKTYYQSSMSVHGSKPGQMVYSFNGLKMSWPGGGGGATAFYTDNDAMQEMQALTDSAGAEVSVGGVFLNMVTKTGSNQLHGGLSSYYSTHGIQSQLKFPLYNGVPVSTGNGPLVMLRDLEANAGAPVVKDRFWLFGSWRYLVTKEMMYNIPRKDGSIPSSGNHQTNTTFRGDWQISNSDRLAFTWWYNEQNQYYRRASSPPYIDDQAAYRQIEPAYILQADWTKVVGANFVVDTRLGYMHLIFPLTYEPGVKPSDISVQDTVLGTLKGAATQNQVEPAQEWRVSQDATYFRNFLGGSHNFKFGWDDSTNRNQFIQNVNQNIREIYQGGAAFQVQVMDGPKTEKSVFHEGGAFIQDAWTLKRRLTLNLGVRFDHWYGFNPDQSSPPADFFPQLFPTRSFKEQKVATWNNFSPRVGVALDIKGNSRSVLRASYSRFLLTQGTGLGETINPNLLSGYVYRWTDCNLDGIAQSNEFLTNCAGVAQKSVGTVGSINTRIDSNLKRPYSDTVSVGYEQEVFGQVKLGASYYYRTTRRQLGRYNMALLPGDYTPISAFKGAPIVNPLTNQPLTLYTLAAAKVGLADYLVTNVSAADDNAYHSLEFTANKRMTHNWLLLTGFTIQRNRGLYSAGTSDDFNDPNRDINRAGSALDQDATYTLKVMGQYHVPRIGVSFSVNAQHYTGYPIQPSASYTSGNAGLNQSSETVVLLPRGNVRLPSVDQISLRFSRPTRINERVRLEPTVDLFNITNSNSITGMFATYNLAPSASSPQRYLIPTDVINPRVVKFGLKLTF